MQKQSVPEGPCPVEETHGGAVWEGPMLEKLIEDCLLWEGTHAGTVD